MCIENVTTTSVSSGAGNGSIRAAAAGTGRDAIGAADTGGTEGAGDSGAVLLRWASTALR